MFVLTSHSRGFFSNRGNIMNKKRFEKGDVICRQSTPGDEMYIILSGKVKVYITLNAENIVLSVFEKNDFFGEMCLLLGEHRSATVEAMEDTEVMAITMDTILSKLRDDPEFALRGLKTLAKRLKEAHSVISKIEGESKSLQIIHGT